MIVLMKKELQHPVEIGSQFARQMIADHLIHGQLGYPVSMTLITAALLLLLGLIGSSAW
jgi:hypothetical protein